MSIKVNMSSPHLRQLTHRPEPVEVNGSTVGECLQHLVKQFPEIEKRLFDKHGQLLNYAYLFINGKGTHPTDLGKPVKDGDELTIGYLLAGG